MFELTFLAGDTEPEGVDLVMHESENNLPQHIIDRIRQRHADNRKGIRDVSLVGFGVDHGLNAHAGNGSAWRTTPIAVIQLDYLKGKPLAYARLEESDVFELLSQLSAAIAIKERNLDEA